MDSNDDMIVSAQGEATDPKGWSLGFLSGKRLMHRWSFGRIIDIIKDLKVSTQEGDMAQKGEPLSFFSWPRLMHRLLLGK